MALYELGPIAYLNKGAYDASTVYTKYDVVLYNNGSYVYVNDTDLSGNLPTDTTYWQAMLDPTAMNEATRFVHIKYSNYESPTNEQMNSTSGDYIGISVTNSQDAPTTSSSYTWNKVKGADGAKGDPGDTPVRGADYWTTADVNAMKAHIEDYVDTNILGGAS